MNGDRRHEILLVLTVGLAIWAIIAFFFNAYFAAFFYGVPVPSWASWVGSLPIWAFNVIDTVFVAILVLAVVLASSRSRPRSTWKGRRGLGSVGGAVLALLVLLALGIFLFLAFGITFSGLLNAARGFFIPGS